MKTRHIRQLIFAIILLAFLLPVGIPVHAASPFQEDDPCAQCAEGVQLFMEGWYAEALPLLEVGFAGRENATCAAPDDMGICASALGFILDEMGDRTGALEAYTVALEIFQSSGNRAFEEPTLNNIGDVYYNQGRYAEALEMFEQALTIVREVGDRVGEGTTLNNIGDVHKALGQYQEALRYYEEALVILREIGDRAEEGRVLRNIGIVYRELGQYQEVLKYYEESLAISREIGDRAGERSTLNNIGIVYEELGQYQEALQYYEESLAISREIGDRAGERSTLNNIGIVYEELGQYQEAVKYYEESLAIIREIGDRAGERSTLNNIGDVYKAQGQYQEALKYYEESLAIIREIGDRAGEGDTLNNIGDVYKAQGQYKKALDYYQRSLAISREIGDRAGEGTTLNNIGAVYYKLGQYPEALDYYQQSLAIFEELGDQQAVRQIGDMIEQVSNALFVEGLELYETGEYQTALEKWQAALEIYREIGDRAAEGRVLRNIGDVYKAQGQYQEALKYCEKALAIRREIGDRRGEGSTLNSIGNVYYTQGQYQEALEYYKESLVILREIGDREGEGTTLYNIGAVYYKLEQYPEALKYYEKAKELDPTLVIPDIPAPSNRPQVLAFSTTSALVFLLGSVYFFVARPNRMPLTTALSLFISPRQLILAAGGGYVERSWSQWQRSVESNIMRQRRVTGQTLTDIPRQFRGYALQRYHQERQAEEDLSFEKDGLSLRPSAKTRAWLKDSEKAMAVLGGDDAQQREEFEQQSAALVKVLSGALGLVQVKSRSYRRMYGYVVEAPALRLGGVPPSFPVIFPQRTTYDKNDIGHLADFMGVLGMTDFFALLVAFDLPGDGHNVAGLRRLVKDSPYAHEFIVLGNDDVLSILKARDSNARLIQLLLDQMDLSRVSPYVTDGPVPENMFFGRESEIKAITQTIKDNDFALAGGRKIGKTSTLQKINRLLDKDARYSTFYLDCQPITTYEEFFDVLGRKLERELDAAPASFRDVVTWLKQEAGDKLVVVLLDEVDNLLRYDVEREERLFKVFRSLSQEGYCRFVFCGGKALYRRIHHSDSPFFNFCKDIILGHLDEKSATEIVTRPMDDMGIELQDKDQLVAQIIGLSSCHPNLVQFICEHLINRIRERRITLEDLHAVTTAQEFDQYFIETTWGQSTPLEKIITLAMLDRQSFTRGEVYATLGDRGVEDKTAIDEALETLKLYTLLRQEGKNYLYALTQFPRIVRESEDVEALIESLLGRV